MTRPDRSAAPPAAPAPLEAASASLKAASLFLLLALGLAGCRGPTGTIRELGFPAFEPVVGAETVLERPDPHQTQGFDAFTDDVDPEGDHFFVVRFLPLSSLETVAIEVKARARSRPELSELAMAVYPATRTEAERFRVTGALPQPSAPPLAFARGGERDPAGDLTLALLFPRSAIPEGTERLLVPSLARFTDGWIHVRFYQTAIPDPIKQLTPEEVEAMRRTLEAAGGQPPPANGGGDGGGGGGGAPPSEPPAEPPQPPRSE